MLGSLVSVVERDCRKEYQFEHLTIKYKNYCEKIKKKKKKKKNPSSTF